MPTTPKTAARTDLFSVETLNGSHEIRLHAPGRYIIEITCQTRDIPFVPLTVKLPCCLDRVVYLPATERTSYLLESTENGLSLHFDRRSIVECHIRPIRIRDLGRLLRRRRRQRQWKQSLVQLPAGSEVTLRPLLYAGTAKERELALALRGLAGWGLGPATASLQGILARSFGGPSPLTPNRPALSPLRIGIVVHLHYQELWPDFEALLARLDRPFRLIVTLTKPSQDLSDRIKTAFPEAETISYKNRGRDVGPFVQLFRDGRLDDFDLICKLHGKKSALDGPRAALGDIWRLASLYDLIGDRDTVDKIVNTFERSPELGMLGSDHFRLPNAWKDEKAAWGNNETKTRELLTTMGITSIPPIDFFAGTMFWVRREALAPLKKLDLAIDSFPDEAGQEDGTLQHALERAMAMMTSNKIGV